MKSKLWFPYPWKASLANRNVSLTGNNSIQVSGELYIKFNQDYILVQKSVVACNLQQFFNFLRLSCICCYPTQHRRSKSKTTEEPLMYWSTALISKVQWMQIYHTFKLLYIHLLLTNHKNYITNILYINRITQNKR